MYIYTLYGSYIMLNKPRVFKPHSSDPDQVPSPIDSSLFLFIWKSSVFIRTRMDDGQQAFLLVISADLEIATGALYLQRDDVEHCKSWKVQITLNFHLDVLFIQMYLKDHSYESTTVAKLYLILAIICLL